MSRLNLVLSLITEDNDFQREQAVAAEAAAVKLGVNLRVIFAANDSINQSQQLLKVIQTPELRPDGIAFEPISGTGLAQVAKAAVAAGIGWTIVNREVDYLPALRASGKRVPAFAVSTDHKEIGRIQGRQLQALVPKGGVALYIQGPGQASASEARTYGMLQVKPENIQLRTMKGNWTRESGHAAVSSWLRLSTSHELQVVAVVAQNDSMAMGARQAFESETTGAERERWLSLPFLGCDGLPDTGAAWVRKKLLAATVIMPPSAGIALEMLTQALRSGTQPPECTMTTPESYPAIDQLRPVVVKSAIATAR